MDPSDAPSPWGQTQKKEGVSGDSDGVSKPGTFWPPLCGSCRRDGLLLAVVCRNNKRL